MATAPTRATTTATVVVIVIAAVVDPETAMTDDGTIRAGTGIGTGTGAGTGTGIGTEGMIATGTGTEEEIGIETGIEAKGGVGNEKLRLYHLAPSTASCWCLAILWKPTSPSCHPS